MPEELGLQVNQDELEYIACFRSMSRPAPSFINNSFNEMFILHRDCNPSKLKLQTEEVSEALFVDINKLQTMVNAKDPGLVPHDRMYARLFKIVL